MSREELSICSCSGEGVLSDKNHHNDGSKFTAYKPIYFLMHYHLGINLGHERSVAIVQDGEILVAIEQERIDRQKYSPGYMLHSPGDASQIQLPHEAIRYAIDAIGIGMGDLETITANMPGHDYAPEILRRTLPPELVHKVRQIPSHHLAHAYTAYYPSGFEESIILVVDASGGTTNRQTESYTIYTGRDTQISTLHSETVAAHLAGLSTLGFVYEYVTRKAGFVSKISEKVRHAEAGKLMGLAPFGQHQPNFQRWIQTMADDFSVKISAYDIFLEIAALEKLYDKGEGKPYLRSYLVDLAYKVQQELEQALLHIVGLAVERTGLKKLCIAGGVGLNSVANYQLLKQLVLDDIFIFPAAGDSGIAAGCALWADHQVGGSKRFKLTKADLGKQYSLQDVELAIAQFATEIVVEELSPAMIVPRAAQSLAQGNIVARFAGGAEYGPRALGQRSIMADPTFQRMKDIINARVKFREAFRPFAPVIPLESVSTVFEQQVAAPFMLVVPQIKKEFHDVIPAVTHVDGTGRVQTVTAVDNPYFHSLCHQLVRERQGVPVLLNTSFNVAGQPIVETPAEAIETFLQTDIDYLAIENFWISKKHVPVLNYAEHLTKVTDSALPKGLPANTPGVIELMTKLDQALFHNKTANCPWSLAELQKLSSAGAVYKETSKLFPHTRGLRQLQTQLSPSVLLLPDPLGKSTLVDLTGKVKSTAYSWSEVQLLLTVQRNQERELADLRQAWQLTPRELEAKFNWAQQQLDQYQLKLQPSASKTTPPDSDLTTVAEQTFAPFAEESFSARIILRQLYDCLHRWEYTDAKISELLGLTSQQHIEPTRIHYYDRYLLPQNPLSDLIRLFHLKVALPQVVLQELFTPALFKALVNMGLLIPRGEYWSSRVDLFEAAGLYIATDHRYMLLPEDKIDEDPVMYLGMDSMGLVHTAPRYKVDCILDLCTGSGIQALTASRYAHRVVGVDINPRALRFARFNAQLNSIEHVQFRSGNLYQAVSGKFDIILANPPFVPSPSQEYRFRDGGANGEEVLAQIISGSTEHLTANGHLFIVTDLVDLPKYQQKLAQWWTGGKADQLILHTADRDDILFSVPHSHAPFGQTICEYRDELDRWLGNFHRAGLTAVNFGYILIQRLAKSHQQHTYYSRTIHNPHQSIEAEVRQYFRQRGRWMHPQVDKCYLTLHPDLRFRYEINPHTGEQQVELFTVDNPYFTTYPISQQLYLRLQEIFNTQPQFGTYINHANHDWIHDLVCKGILLVKFTQTDSAGHPITPVSFTAVSKQSDPSQPAEPVEHQELSIAELQTKTTPTCLSSYLS
jgi:carbamoyltransferase